MYQSSSESSIEHGNFPSVINLYAVDQQSRNVSHSSQATSPGIPSHSLMSNWMASAKIPQTQSVCSASENIFKNQYSVPRGMSYDRPVEQFHLLPMHTSQTHVHPSIQNNFNVLSQHSSQSQFSKAAFLIPNDREGSCGSPKSTTDDDGDSDTDTGDESFKNKPRRKDSTTSTSTSSSSSEDPRWGGLTQNNCINSRGSSTAPLLPPPMPSLASHQIGANPLLYRPSPLGPSAGNSMNIVGSPSPSSNTVSSGSSSAVVQVRHSMVSHCSAGGKIHSSLAHAVESIALQSQLGVDSGISNTSPETQSSTEFQQRSLDGDGSGSLALGASAGACLSGGIVPSGMFLGAASGETGGILGSGCLISSSSAGMLPQSILKIRCDTQNQNQMQEAFKTSLFNLLSSLYAMFLVLLGCILPLTEVISEPIALHMFEGFYFYLFIASILFLVYVYAYLMRNEADCFWSRSTHHTRNYGDAYSMHSALTQPAARKKKIVLDYTGASGSSFYLRLGAVGFGLASMIRDGLEAGRLFEVSGRYAACGSLMLASRPLLSLVFSFIQLYFIFLNSKMCIHKYKVFARFGIMHMFATNLCVWLRCVIKETFSDTILTSVTPGMSKMVNNLTSSTVSLIPSAGISRNFNVLRNDNNSLACRTENLLGGVVENAAPYLYPCTVQYSFIAAGILWITWRNIGKLIRTDMDTESPDSADKRYQVRVSVDCSGSNRGLFLGLFMFVTGTVCVIVFCVLRNRPVYTLTALRVIYAGEAVLLLVTLLAVLTAFFKMQDMLFYADKDNFLDDIFHFVSLVGVLTYAVLAILAGRAFPHEPVAPLLVASGLLSVLQSITQSIFVVTAMRRMSYKAIHEIEKPGREFLSFLLICNLALWALYTLEERRSEPAALLQRLCGRAGWAIFSHLCVPLVIFYRFHSAVCLSVVWKNAYKFKGH